MTRTCQGSLPEILRHFYFFEITLQTKKKEESLDAGGKKVEEKKEKEVGEDSFLSKELGQLRQGSWRQSPSLFSPSLHPKLRNLAPSLLFRLYFLIKATISKHACFDLLYISLLQKRSIEVHVFFGTNAHS